MTNLSQMSVLEPVLIKHMLANIVTELSGIESALPGLRKRGLDLEEVEGSWHECQVRILSLGGRSLRECLLVTDGHKQLSVNNQGRLC